MTRFSNGAMAEYCIAPSSAVALKPSRLSHNEAASVPMGALTAWQGLFDRARLQAGERVLVHGGAGAVGVYVVQLARLHGAHVVATASGADAAFVRELGAEQVIDYQAAKFEQIVTGMDVVFDTVGGETLQRSWSVLKTHGRMVTIVSDEQKRHRCPYQKIILYHGAEWDAVDFYRESATKRATASGAGRSGSPIAGAGSLRRPDTAPRTRQSGRGGSGKRRLILNCLR